MLQIELIQSLNYCYGNSFVRRVVLSDALMKKYETPGSYFECFDNLLDGAPKAENFQKVISLLRNLELTIKRIDGDGNLALLST